MATEYRTPLLPFPPKRQEQFWSTVKKLADDECWEWQGCKTDRNYGTVYIRGKVVKAHRVAFAITFNVEPANHVLHTCDNPPCCNPAHLFEGTYKDNAIDRQAKGRSAAHVGRTGESCHLAKLTQKQVDHIRSVYHSLPNASRYLANTFGVSPCTIRDIMAGRSWRITL